MRNRRIRTSIQAQFQAGPVEGKGTIRNLSEGGLFVRTRSIPEQGETVRLHFSTGRRSLELSGMVWWTTADDPLQPRRHGFGLRLLDQNEAYLQFVESLQR